MKTAKEWVTHFESQVTYHTNRAAEYLDKAEIASKRKDRWDDLLRIPVSGADFCVQDAEYELARAEECQREFDIIKNAMSLPSRIGLIVEEGTPTGGYIGPYFRLFKEVTVEGMKRMKQITYQGQRDLIPHYVVDICMAKLTSNDRE